MNDYFNEWNKAIKEMPLDMKRRQNKVFILSTHMSHAGDIIHGVYLSREKAEKDMKKLTFGEPRIQEFEVLE